MDGRERKTYALTYVTLDRFVSFIDFKFYYRSVEAKKKKLASNVHNCRSLIFCNIVSIYYSGYR